MFFNCYKVPCMLRRDFPRTKVPSQLGESSSQIPDATQADKPQNFIFFIRCSISSFRERFFFRCQTFRCSCDALRQINLRKIHERIRFCGGFILSSLSSVANLKKNSHQLSNVKTAFSLCCKNDFSRCNMKVSNVISLHPQPSTP